MTDTMEKWMAHKKKLIEVALPLEAINKACAREKSIRHGHPNTLHLWWARRPLAAARAVIFAQMVDDPSGHPDQFPTIEIQEKERQRLFGLIEELVQWENTMNEDVLERARKEIQDSWRKTCLDNKDHPQASELFNPTKLPGFHDPFAGGGTLPLEAQRLGLESYASDLNPVAVLINKAMIEIPPKFAGRPPVNPQQRNDKLRIPTVWHGTQGLAEDVRYYGQWMLNKAKKKIGHLYPKIEITEEMTEERPDLKGMVGQELTMIACLWARTVKSPNPAFAHMEVPLTSTFILSANPKKGAYLEPILEKMKYRFRVRVGQPENQEAAKQGTKLSRGANFRCIMSGTPITSEYIKEEGRAGRMNAQLLAIVAEGKQGRIYLPPTKKMEEIAQQAQPTWKPDTPLAKDPRALWTPSYGLTTFSDLFTKRQLVALTTFSDLVLEAREKIFADLNASGLLDDGKKTEIEEEDATAYADAVVIYLTQGISRLANRLSTICIWNRVRESIEQVFARQAIPMTWDFAEANPFSDSTGSWSGSLEWIPLVIESLPSKTPGIATQADASLQSISLNKLISTDPPYYDNIGYADLSDFFYIWLRRSLKTIFPQLFATLSVPKKEELVAIPYRHNSKKQAEVFFLEGMTKAMQQLTNQTHPSFPVTIYYAFKQSETENEAGTASTGWETFLEAVFRAGFVLTGTMPVRTERDYGVKSGTNVLSSCIILVCRPRLSNAPSITRREFLTHLKRELPPAITRLKNSDLAAVDLQQAAIGPGMAVFTRYSSVIDSMGKSMSVREALSLINQILDEAQTEQESDFESVTRWALAWFEDFGFTDGPYGEAEKLSTSTNISIDNLVKSNLVLSKAGKVRLLKPDEMPSNWNPEIAPCITVWEVLHQIIRALNQSEQTAANLVAILGSKIDSARDLAYRLYVMCERKKRAQEALAYNGLVQSWPEIKRLSQQRQDKQETFI